MILIIDMQKFLLNENDGILLIKIEIFIVNFFIKNFLKNKNVK